MERTLLFVFFLSSLSNLLMPQAQAGLVVNAVEIGIGKFHRYDNQRHPYASDNVWKAFVLPDGVDTSGTLGTPYVVDNADGSVTVFFSTLDEIISTVTGISTQTGQPVEVLNIHGHGLPGAMWFPASAEALHSSGCADWVKAATGPDSDNYDQYYSPISADDIQSVQQISAFHASARARSQLAKKAPGTKVVGASLPCTTGLDEWSAAASPDFVHSFASNAQIHFLSCVIGLGTDGQEFTEGFAQAVLPGGSGRVEAALDFGLNDWSTPEGMAFWDLDNPDLAHANTIYPVDRQDREVMEKGTIRVAIPGASGWTSVLRTGIQFMLVSFEADPLPGEAQTPPLTVGAPLSRTHMAESAEDSQAALPAVPDSVRIPGTTVRIQVPR